MTITPDNFFSQPVAPPAIEDEVPRDQWGRPKITMPDGTTKPYSRASSFGNILDDRTRLELWIQRQSIRGLAMSPDLIHRVNTIGDPEVDPRTKSSKNKQLNSILEAAQEAAGSNVKSTLGTAIHAATERIDKGEDISDLPPFLQERAITYWRFCKAEGIRPTSVEVFGVEDIHQVAGTWDRTGWFRRRHKICDVKTSGTMDFAGIVFAVQLAEYAHMSAYDMVTGARTPHEIMDLEEGIIIHVGREEGSPVELYEVDLTVGWEWAKLVALVKLARKDGSHAIRPVSALDAISQMIVDAPTVEALHSLYVRNGSSWGPHHRALATTASLEFASGQ